MLISISRLTWGTEIGFGDHDPLLLQGKLIRPHLSPLHEACRQDGEQVHLQHAFGLHACAFARACIGACVIH